ncbi:MAG: solute carrier family 23 protein, partial [Microbacterium sp.]
MKKRTTAARPEDERLPIGVTVAYGIQHVLTMYGGIIAPPLIIGSMAGLNGAEIGVLITACLFMGGLATILQTVGIPFFGS